MTDADRMAKFVEAASQPGARILVALDVGEWLRSYEFREGHSRLVYLDLKGKRIDVDRDLPSGTITAIQRCKCGFDPCQPWRHGGWQP